MFPLLLEPSMSFIHFRISAVTQPGQVTLFSQISNYTIVYNLRNVVTYTCDQC